MRLYNIISIAFWLAVVAAGTVLKLVLRKRRKRQDGFHGYINEEERQSTADEWELPQ